MNGFRNMSQPHGRPASARAGCTCAGCSRAAVPPAARACCQRNEDGLLPQHALEEPLSSPMSESSEGPLERAHDVRQLSSCSSNGAPPCSLSINEHDDDALRGLALDQEADNRASSAQG